ncbi:MAG: hypothetical protein AAFR52_00835 [Pseudomonadota bacterium]
MSRSVMLGVGVVAVVILAVLGVMQLEDSPGPAEQAGEAVDEAVGAVEGAIEDATTEATGN